MPTTYGLGIYRRGDVFWWQRRIPKKLQHFFNKPTQRCSTRSHITATAKKRAVRLIALTNEFFDGIEKGRTMLSKEDKAKNDEILNAMVRNELDRNEEKRAKRGPHTREEALEEISRLKRLIASYEEKLQLGETDHAWNPLSGTAVRNGIKMDPDSEAFKILERQAAIKLIEIAKIDLKREQGIYEDNVSAPVEMQVANDVTSVERKVSNGMSFNAPVPAPLIGYGAYPVNVGIASFQVNESESKDKAVVDVSSDAETSSSSITITEAIDRFIESRTTKTKKWKEGSDMPKKYTKAGQLLAESIGDMPLNEVSRNDIYLTRDLLIQLPQNYGKSPKKKETFTVHDWVNEGESVRSDQLEKLDLLRESKQIDNKTYDLEKSKLDDYLIDPGTINVHIQNLSTFFEWAKEEGLYSGENPAKSVRFSQTELDNIREGRTPRNRLPWGRDRIRELFGSALFASPVRDAHQEALFWGVLIASHHTNRSEEIYQLQLDDIVKEDGIWVMNLSAGPGKRLKNRTSQRTVPIHSKIIEAGFIDRLEGLKNAGAKWLFPEIDRGVNRGTFTDNMTKHFTRYRQDVGLYDKHRDFHSLRMDANKMMKKAGVGYTERAQIMGHKIQNETDGTYDPEGHTVEELKASIDTIDYGIDFKFIDGSPVIVLREGAE